jgi:hypothetical protein
MKTIKIEALKTFTPEMEKFRCKGFCLEDSEIAVEDKFDSKSTHILASCEDEIIGMVRLTQNPTSVLLSWSGGEAPIPNRTDVIEATRAMVAGVWQGKDIFKLLMTETMIKAKKLGAKIAFASIEPGLKHCNFLYNIGFQNVGKQFFNLHPPINKTPCQTIIQLPNEDFEKVIEAREKIIKGNKLKDFKIVSEIADNSFNALGLQTKTQASIFIGQQLI